AAALPFLRLLDLVTRHELLVARQHEIARATLLWVEPKTRLLRALGRNADLPVLRYIGNARILQALLHRLANLRARAAQDPLAIGEAFALGVQTAIDEIGHAIGAVIPASEAKRSVSRDPPQRFTVGPGSCAVALVRDDIGIITPPCSPACTIRRGAAP